MKPISFYFLFCVLLNAIAQSPSAATKKASVQIKYTPNRPANIFTPVTTLGAAFDGHKEGDMQRILTKENIDAMHTVGLHPLSYRLRTELAGEVWHWNTKGTWSEAGKQQGYWVSDSSFTEPIMITNGYRLPHRGNTIDQANDDGYSRLDDDDVATFWKSNPYLDTYFTKEPNEQHPQWAIIDLGKLMDVNAIRINWGTPYALSYQVDYALDIGSDYFEPFQPKLWHPFSNRNIAKQTGGNKIITVSNKPIRVRFVRITMTQGSHTSAVKNSTDIRDQLGFAIKEMAVGLVDKNGVFTDWVHHGISNKIQSNAYVSSTDPWHRASDISPNTEQCGIDRFFTCDLVGEQPTMMPIGLLYDTPENILALVHYIQARHYNVNELEMGEEPEGQLISPVDYACLYYQWITLIRKIAPDMHFGGPGFATLDFSEPDTTAFTEGTWTKLFMDYLKQHHSLDAFNFFSFEWYPFDDLCEPTAPQLAMQPKMLDNALSNILHNILPKEMPVYITEYGYSAFEGKAEAEIEGALMYADILGKFLTLGGTRAYLYGYEPADLQLIDKCDYGNNMLFGMDKSGNIAYRVAAYYGEKMLTQQWAQPQDSALEIYPVTCDLLNTKHQPLISAYAIRRPDKKWSMLLINKDQKKSWNADVSILNTTNSTSATLHFPLQCVQYSGQQYHWLNLGKKSHPGLELPPVEKTITSENVISLPPYSMTVVTEK